MVPVLRVRCLDDLTQYFHSFLIGGAGSFVVTADDFEDFHYAMEIKLHREINGPSLGQSTVPQIVTVDEAAANG